MLAWAREQGVSADDELSYLREFEHITLARVLLAQSHAGDFHRLSAGLVAQLVDRLLRAAEAGLRTGSVIEVLVLQALTRQADGDMPGALESLGIALILPNRGGYVRVFVGRSTDRHVATDERVTKQRAGSDYVRRLLAACRDSAGDATRCSNHSTGQRPQIDHRATTRELTT